MICEKCNKEHSGKYGSGRFCSSKCAHSRALTDESKKRIGKKLLGNIPWNKGMKMSFKSRKKKNNKTCKCGTLFHKNSKYCSVKCAVKYTDYSASNRKAYANGRKVSGGTCKWLLYKNIKVQGTYELRMCKVLDKMKELNDIKSWEYTNDRIKYFAEDDTEHYLLDFKVINNDDSIKYFETKGFLQERDLYKWKACKRKNIHLEIVFKKDLKDLENKYLSVA